MLALWTQDRLPLPSLWGATPIQKKKYGMRPGEKAESVLLGQNAILAFADPRPRPRDGYPPGEDENGIAIDRHPEAMLRDNPRLRWIVNLWRSPVPRELPYEVVSGMTHLEREAWSVMLGAWYRASKGPPRGGK